MSSPFVAEIRMVGFNFPPTGWAYCNGQLLPISQNTALFSLLGTIYGGDGKSTFALPDMQGNAAMFWGQGQGLSLHDQGETGGSDSVTLLESEIPAHTHGLRGNNTLGDTPVPAANTLARANGQYQQTVSSLVAMNAQSLAPSGSSFPHNNLMPYLTINFIIALQGVFPARP